MSPSLRRVAVAVGVVAAVVLLVTGGRRIVERQRTATEINRLRDELYRARVASDRCRTQLVSSESAIQTLSLTIDSLRSRVDSFEALDRRGVPEAQYDAYLESFDSYNDSVEVWEARERRLRAAEQACRGTIEAHNELSDSLQRVLESAGIDAG